MSKSSFGHGVGLAFKESNLVLNTKNQETVKYASPLCWHAPAAASHACLSFTTPRAGMTFVVTVSLHGVPLTDRRSSSSSVVSKLEKFDILLVDTVVANAKASDILTSKAHRELADVSWEIGDGEEEDEEEDEDEAKAEPEEPAAGRSVRPVCVCVAAAVAVRVCVRVCACGTSAPAVTFLAHSHPLPLALSVTVPVVFKSWRPRPAARRLWKRPSSALRSKYAFDCGRRSWRWRR